MANFDQYAFNNEDFVYSVSEEEVFFVNFSDESPVMRISNAAADFFKLVFIQRLPDQEARAKIFELYDVNSERLDKDLVDLHTQLVSRNIIKPN
jgi:hypothetical protein